MEPISALITQHLLLQVVGWGSAAASLGAIWEYVLKPSYHAFKKVKKIVLSFDEKLGLIDQIILSIGPSGSSIAESLERMEKYLHVLDLRQGAVFELSAVPFFQSGVEGNYTHVNRCWSELFGLGLPEAIGSGWESIIHPDDKDRIVEEWISAVKEERVFVQTFKCICKRGDIITVKCQAVPLKSSELFLGHMGLIYVKKEKEKIIPKKKNPRRYRD